MRATAVLLAWCAGLGAGYLGLLTPSREFAVVAAAFIAMAAGLWLISRPGARTPAAAENQAPPMPVVWAAVILLSGAALLLGLVRGEAGRAPSGPGSVQAYLGQTVALNGRVEAAALPAGGAGANPAAAAQSFHLATVEVDAGGHRVAAAGAVLVQARGHAQVFDGQRVSVRGKLVRLRQVAPGGLTGYADRLERQGVIAELSATSLTALDPPTVFSPGRAAAAVRAGIVTAIRGALPEPEATVVLGEVAGIRGAVPANVDSDLVQSGLVHILAISGIKVAIVAGLLQALTLPLFGRRGALLAIAGLGLYTVVGGATASALRSALMGSLGLVGAVIRRDTDVIRSLLLVGSVMLGHRPALIADLSFQYSFLGVLGIHLFAESLAQRVRIVPQPFREALAVTLAAQLATLPLTAHYFAVVPLLSPLANGLVLPGLPVAIVGGLAISALHAATELLPVALWAQVLGSATVPLAALVFLLTRAALAVAHLVRVIPGAAIAAPGFGAPATAAYYAAGAVVVAGQARRWPRLRMAALAAGLALAALLVLGHPDGRLHLVFASGVTGPVAVLVAPDGATMLLGAGSSAAALGPALDAELPVAAPLPGMPRRLDAVVLTGGSREEAGGLAAVASRRVGVAIAPEGLTGAAATGALARIQAQGAEVIRLRPGDTVPWHGLDVVARAGSGPGEIAVEIRWGAVRVLVVSAADPGNVPMLPAGDYAAVALGSGAVDPGLGGVNAGAIVLQAAASSAAGAPPAAASAAPAHPVARALAQAAGDRLWETSRDGPLRLRCDRSGCSRG